MRKSNIILIGMPGAGKSTVGVVLAKIIAYDFIDSDLVIQKRAGKKLAGIISDEGVDGFIKAEEEANLSINCENCVIATGGSAVYSEKAMAHFKESGIIIYLKVEINELKKRLNNIEQRGVVLREGQTFEELFEERSRLYEKYADITVLEENKTIEDIIRDIREEL